MSTARRLIFASPVYSKSVDSSRLSVTATLTYPTLDRAGDYVHPAGIDWTLHKSDPRVGFEHFRIGYDGSVLAPGEKGFRSDLPMVTVGWASPSFGKDRDYSVVQKSLNIDGQKHTLPVGTTYFNKSDRLSYQTFQMVKDDALPGVSIEFTLIDGYYKAIGRSPIEDRSAYRVDACNGLGYVHCKTPVNPGALVAKSLTAGQELILKCVTDRKVGGEEIHPVLFKSFSPMLKAKSTSVVSGFVGVKAMDDMAASGMETAYEQPMDDQTDLEPEGPPTAKLCYELAQAFKDIVDHGRSGVKSSEHIPAKKKTLAGLDKAEALAGYFMSLAQKIEADVGDEVEDIDLYDEEETPKEAPEESAEPPVADDGAEEPEEPEESDDEDKKPFKAILDRRADGILKAIPDWAVSRIRRFSVAELKAAPVVKSSTVNEPDIDNGATVQDWLDWAEKNDPQAFRKVRKAEAATRWAS